VHSKVIHQSWAKKFKGAMGFILYTVILIRTCHWRILGGAKGDMPPPPKKNCQRWRGLSRAHLNNPSTAKSRQLLGDFDSQTAYRGSAPGPRWETSVPQTLWIGPLQVHFLNPPLLWSQHKLKAPTPCTHARTERRTGQKHHASGGLQDGRLMHNN